MLGGYLAHATVQTREFVAMFLDGQPLVMARGGLDDGEELHRQGKPTAALRPRTLAVPSGSSPVDVSDDEISDSSQALTPVISAVMVPVAKTTPPEKTSIVCARGSKSRRGLFSEGLESNSISPSPSSTSRVARVTPAGGSALLLVQAAVQGGLRDTEQGCGNAPVAAGTPHGLIDQQVGGLAEHGKPFAAGEDVRVVEGRGGVGFRLRLGDRKSAQGEMNARPALSPGVGIVGFVNER